MSSLQTIISEEGWVSSCNGGTDEVTSHVLSCADEAVDVSPACLQQNQHMMAASPSNL